MARYRFTTTDGQVHESTVSPEEILKAHPGATITHTVATDETTGESTLVAYDAEEAVKTGPTKPADDTEDEDTEDTTTTAEPAPEPEPVEAK